MAEQRIETDSLGEIAVPTAAYWGAQTQRSIANFPFASTERMPQAIIHALALVKQAAARVNRDYGLPPELAEAIGGEERDKHRHHRRGEREKPDLIDERKH